jgi:transcriptional regulator with PAS, ATPase and Fis domain
MDRDLKLIGKSPQIKELRIFIKMAAKTDANVLLLGETGVGKDVAARKIHLLSRRRSKPFIKTNCANLSENLVESDLFGHKKGAFTGAIHDKSGLLEEADGGTFFFDEIADISPQIQAKFLTVIEDRQLRRLGENRNRKIDVRFILATNMDLFQLVEKDKFRKDLYFRINILRFYIPSLKERKEDVPALVEYILNKINAANKMNKKISEKALNKLTEYHYLGNIRELENIVTKAYFFSKGDNIKDKDIELEYHISDKNFDRAEILYKEILENKKIYWEVIHKPFLKRELDRATVKQILSLGLKETGGSYKKLLSLFNMSLDEKEYQKFMKILRVHRLR